MASLITNQFPNPLIMSTKTHIRLLTHHMAHSIGLQTNRRASYEMRLEYPHCIIRDMNTHKFEPMSGNFLTQCGIMNQLKGKHLWEACNSVLRCGLASFLACLVGAVFALLNSTSSRPPGDSRVYPFETFQCKGSLEFSDCFKFELLWIGLHLCLFSR